MRFIRPIRLLLALIPVLSASLLAQGDDTLAGGGGLTGRTISGITLFGNRTTREEIARLIMGIDSGDVFDSSLVAQGKARLMATGVYTRVEIFPVPDDDQVRLQVVMIESPRLALSDIGGDFCLRYGKVADKFWQRGKGRLGVSLLNFRGKMERLSMAITLLEWRSLSLSWYKPFLGTPWYLQSGASVSDNPSLNVPLRTQSGVVSMTVGHRFLQAATVYGTLTPAVRNTQFVDRRSAHTLYYIVDDTTVDSSRFVQDTFAYPYENLTFFEGMISMGWSLDRRDTRFDPHRGFYLFAQGKTNILYPDDQIYRDYKRFRDSSEFDAGEQEILLQYGRTFDPAQRLELLSQRYFQIDAQAMWYHRGFWRKDVFAYRARLLLRNREGGLLNRVSAGGESTLRGYASGAVSNDDQANNLFAASMEYRFSLWQTPETDAFGWLDLSALGYDLKGLYYRIDGGWFADGVYLWDTWDEPVHPFGGHEKAVSTGVGLRIVAPTVLHTIALDFTPLCFNESARGSEWSWSGLRWSLYLDLYF